MRDIDYSNAIAEEVAARTATYTQMVVASLLYRIDVARQRAKGTGETHCILWDSLARFYSVTPLSDVVFEDEILFSVTSGGSITAKKKGEGK